MAASKSSASLLSAVTTTQTSSAADVSTWSGQTVYASIVVVGTPTAAASIKVQWSPDGGTTYFDSSVYSTLLAAGTYAWTIATPPDATHIKVVFTAQTGGTSSTCTAIVGRVTM